MSTYPQPSPERATDLKENIASVLAEVQSVNDKVSDRAHIRLTTRSLTPSSFSLSPLRLDL